MKQSEARVQGQAADGCAWPRPHTAGATTAAQPQERWRPAEQQLWAAAAVPVLCEPPAVAPADSCDGDRQGDVAARWRGAAEYAAQHGAGQGAGARVFHAQVGACTAHPEQGGRGATLQRHDCLSHSQAAAATQLGCMAASAFCSMPDPSLHACPVPPVCSPAGEKVQRWQQKIEATQHELPDVGTGGSMGD